MQEIVFYLLTMVLIYLLYYLFVVKNKRRLKKFENNTYVNYLVGVYKLDRNKIPMKQMAKAVAMINSFIIATTILIISVISNLILKFVVGFIILIPLQILMYHIVGKVFQEKFRRDK